jgi:hypothetical protein
VEVFGRRAHDRALARTVRSASEPAPR